MSFTAPVSDQRLTLNAVVGIGELEGGPDAEMVDAVLEGGDSREIGTLFQQVGAAVPSSDGEYHEVTNRLLKGEKPDSIESDLRGRSEQQIATDKKIASQD